MPKLRHLVLASVAAASIVLAAGRAGAESYDTTDAPLTVTPSSGSSAIVPGAPVKVVSSGWLPDAMVSGTLHSDPIFLGLLPANSVGTVDGSFTIPADAPPGDHHIELSGTDLSGSPRVLSVELTIADPTASASAPDELSFTGATVLPMVVGGTVLAGTGVSMLRFRRRRIGIAA